MVTMDWSAKMLGLADHFLNSSGTGGGVIQVTFTPLLWTLSRRLRSTRQLLPTLLL